MLTTVHWRLHVWSGLLGYVLFGSLSYASLRTLSRIYGCRRRLLRIPTIFPYSLLIPG